MALVSVNAFAAKIDVMSIPEQTNLSYASEITVSFNANLENGNAWVEASTPSTEESNGYFDRAKVEGLSVQGNSIVLDVDGQQIECATVKKTFFGPRIKATGNCKFSIKKNVKNVDDGYNGYRLTTYDVSLVTL
jgi:uncharacterized membrane protein